MTATEVFGEVGRDHRVEDFILTDGERIGEPVEIRWGGFRGVVRGVALVDREPVSFGGAHVLLVDGEQPHGQPLGLQGAPDCASDRARTNQQNPCRSRARDAERASHRASAEPVDERGCDDHDERDRDQVLCTAADPGLAQAERERRRGRGRNDPSGCHPGDERSLAPVKRRAERRQRDGEWPADQHEHGDEGDGHPPDLGDLLRRDARREDDEQNPDQERRERADPLSPRTDELGSLDRHALRLGAARWPVDEDRADHQSGDQARVIAEQIGGDDHRDDEHQRPGHGL